MWAILGCYMDLLLYRIFNEWRQAPNLIKEKGMLSKIGFQAQVYICLVSLSTSFSYGSFPWVFQKRCVSLAVLLQEHATLCFLRLLYSTSLIGCHVDKNLLKTRIFSMKKKKKGKKWKEGLRIQRVWGAFFQKLEWNFQPLGSPL